jgi:hypothetical protein
MYYRHCVYEIDVRAQELLKGKCVVEEWLFAHQRVQLPLHQVRRNPLRFGHAIAVEASKLGQASLRAFNAVASPSGGLWSELALELVLFFSREVASSGGKIRIMTHPVGGEVAEKVLCVTLLSRHG